MDTFANIQYEPLRNYNRCVMAFNIREDSGEGATEEYLAQFSKAERMAMLKVYEDVKKIGAEEYKRRLIRTMPLQDDEASV